PDIAGPVTVTVSGQNNVSTTYSLAGGLNNGDVLSKVSENGFTLDATAHAQSKLGAQTTAGISSAAGTITEIFHTSCSCRATPDVNLVVGSPMCLDAGSPDNGPNLICSANDTPNPPGACCDGFDKGTCTGAQVCTGAHTPLFCCSGAGTYAACKGG